MVASKALINRVEELCKQYLTEAGFRRRAQGYTRELGPDVLGWLGLNTATRTYGDSVNVNPVVGVRFHQVERLLAELTGRPHTRYHPPTITEPLYTLVPEPESRRWLFEPDGNLDAVARDLADKAVRYGLAFMEANRTLEQLVANYGGYRNPYFALRLPLAYYLLGRYGEARAAMQRTREEIGADRDLLAEKTLRLFDRVEELIRQQEG